MAIAVRLTDYLETKGVPYEIVFHPKRFTALETAEAEHVSGGHVAKVVMARVDGRDAMFVIPATCRLDLLKVSADLGTADIRVESESEFKNLFEDCEVGGMPPFGALYKMPCYVDLGIAACEHIFFNAGGHEESIRIRTDDYLRIVEARIGDYSVPLH